MPAIKYKPAVADIVRHILLSWLLAAMLEYMLLPGELRDLAGLQSLKGMSLSRVVLLTALFSAGFTVLGLYFRTGKAGRWCIVGGFCMLSFAAIESCSSASNLVSIADTFLSASVSAAGTAQRKVNRRKRRRTGAMPWERRDWRFYSS